MATKAKKNTPAKKPAAPEPAKKSEAAKKDPKAMNKEIGEALFTEEERAGMFFAKHWKKLLVAAILAIVAITAVFAIIKHREAKQKAAIAELALAKTAAELEAAIAKNPKVPGVDAARFRLAKMYENEKKYDKARQTLEALSTSTEDVYNRNRAQLDIGYILELEGKDADAVKKFSALANTATLPPAVRAEAAYAAARLHIARKETAEAQKVLAMILALKIDPATQPGAALWQQRAQLLDCIIN